MIVPLLLQITTRTYWPVTVTQLASGHVAHTHVAVTGTVNYVKHESDGDTHIRLVDGIIFIIAECIPKLPCRIPHVGEHITIKGISRKDGEHGWWEVHPVEELIP